MEGTESHVTFQQSEDEFPSWDAGEAGEEVYPEEMVIPEEPPVVAAWSEPDFNTDWSNFEISDDSTIESDVKMRIIGPAGRETRDERTTVNETHGYTFVDTTEIELTGGVERTVRQFLPRIRQKITTYKKLVPIRVTFAKISDDTEIVEEEEDINEEMEIEEITSTVIIKKRAEDGTEIVEEKDIVHEIIKNPTKRKRFMKLKMINDLGEMVEEVVELNEDSKRTNEIMKLAAPFMRKKTKIVDTKEATKDDDDQDEFDVSPQLLAFPEWFKTNKETQRDNVKSNVIARLKEARDEQRALKERNKYLGKKLCEFFDLKGPKDPNFNYEEKGNKEEHKLKYTKRLLEFNDVINFIFAENKKRADRISSAEKDVQNDAEDLRQEKLHFYDLEENMVKGINPAEEGKTLRSMTFRELINQQKLMDNSLAKVRIDFIRSQIALKDLEDRKAAHQTEIENMDMVDFISYEALRIKTKDLNDKLDLKEKQVLAMKDRLTQRVQALAHVRLKSDHLTLDNEKLRNETKEIIVELSALRTESLKVQSERRKLEERLNRLTSKEGLQKYPYLANEAPNIDAKDKEQLELLKELSATCIELKKELGNKLKEHQEKVEQYQRTQEEKGRQEKLFSFEI